MTTINEPTLFKKFDNWTELSKKTAGYKLYVRTSAKWFVNVTRKAIKETADSMKLNNGSFSGDITYTTGGRRVAQITITCPVS